MPLFEYFSLILHLFFLLFHVVAHAHSFSSVCKVEFFAFTVVCCRHYYWTEFLTATFFSPWVNRRLQFDDCRASFRIDVLASELKVSTLWFSQSRPQHLSTQLDALESISCHSQRTSKEVSTSRTKIYCFNNFTAIIFSHSRGIDGRLCQRVVWRSERICGSCDSLFVRLENDPPRVVCVHSVQHGYINNICCSCC